MIEPPASTYVTGAYWDQNAAMHLEDSAFKFAHARALLRKNGVVPASLVDCGCGAGRVTFLFAQEFAAPTTGLDVSPRAIAAAADLHQHPSLSYRTGAVADEPDGRYDLGLMFDVFEHVEDYFGFLRAARPKARRWLFNIPLDMSVLHVFDGAYMRRRRSVGHLHYFSEASALATLEEAGYAIADRAFAPYHALAIEAASGWRQKLRHMPGQWLYKVNPAAAVRLFGDASLMVLTEPLP